MSQFHDIYDVADRIRTDCLDKGWGFRITESHVRYMLAQTYGIGHATIIAVCDLMFHHEDDHNDEMHEAEANGDSQDSSAGCS